MELARTRQRCPRHLISPEPDNSGHARITLRDCAQFCAHHHSLLSATVCCRHAVSSRQRNTCSNWSHFIVVRVSY